MPEAQKVRHSPIEQRSAPPHVVPQLPQFVVLVCTLTQALLHRLTQSVVQMPLVPQTPRSSGLVALQTAQVAPQPRV
jgi:hypothetical protein